jgi:4-alpha-glucanotransferase
MSDADIHDLARRAGVAVEWTDYADQPHRVSLDTIRRVMAALGLPCDTSDALVHSRHVLNDRGFPRLITATTGQSVRVSIEAEVPEYIRLIQEDGSVTDLPVQRTAGCITLPGIETPGYHTIEIGHTQATLAVAPAKCVTISDLASGERVWGLAAQLYGLRSRGDCGIGDMAGVIALAKATAAFKADALALGPAHALFAADPEHFSPYSPSSRLFYNPLHADAAAVFGEARVAKSRSDIGASREASDLEESALIDWPRSGRIKMRILRRLFDDFLATDLTTKPPSALATDFAAFRAANGSLLAEHALFEALHAARLKADPNAWSWQEWPEEWGGPFGAAARGFAEKNEGEVLFYSFLQWIADRSFAAAQRQVVAAGMRVGLIADLAIGMSGSGSYAWANQSDLLGGLQIGAPPDLFNVNGQNWGLTTFSPRALANGGFAPFIATLRACMRHAGGVRIDHIMGFVRLWVIPHGAAASEGAYLAYPLDDLLRLTALESHRHRVIVIGEDLGTVPVGFRDRLAAAGIYGMGVLWFERNGAGFAPPRSWLADAVAMTSTHDLPTIAGWWQGRDIEVRVRCGLVSDLAAEKTARNSDRKALWKAFRASKASAGKVPTPDQGESVADAAVKFIAHTSSRLALLPLEDALALEDQPNLPGTINEHPNWRRRYSGDAGHLLDPPAVQKRLHPLGGRKEQ